MRTNLLIKVVLFCLSLFISVNAYGGTQNTVWKNAGSGISDSDLKIVKVCPNNPDTVYAASRSAVYKSSNSGRAWKEIFSYRGRGRGVNTITISPSDTNTIFTGTDEGLYTSNDGGLKWKKIYTGIGYLESSVLSVAVDPSNPNAIYIGTRSGLYKTENNEGRWEKGDNLKSGSVISHIVIDTVQQDTIYAAAADGIYKSLNSGRQWEKVFSVRYSKRDSVGEIMESGAGEDEILRLDIAIRQLLIDPDDNTTIYAGTSEGLYITTNAGSGWSKASNTGLISNNIRSIITGPDTDSIYAATDRGVFRYSLKGRWESLYKGLTSSSINYLAIEPSQSNNAASLWAATGKGLFKTESAKRKTDPNLRGMSAEDIFSMFNHEPSIEEIMESAIRYAEVHPDKINAWRKAAAKKAWLPSFRVAYGEGKDWQSSSYYYNYSGSNIYKDDDITEGKDDAWSVSLSWDFSDLVWNSSQTSIDNRSKLMVQLRDDILNEVTRLYFERRRLQTEMVTAPPGELTEKIDKELRLQELTANIDALTGSYLSKRLGQRRKM